MVYSKLQKTVVLGVPALTIAEHTAVTVDEVLGETVVVRPH